MVLGQLRYAIALVLAVMVLFLAPTSVQADEYAFSRNYMDLTKAEKATLKRMTFVRKQCFYASARKKSHLEKDPIKLADRLSQECYGHENEITEYLKKINVNDDFTHDYIQTIRQEIKISLVPYIIQYRQKQMIALKGYYH